MCVNIFRSHLFRNQGRPASNGYSWEWGHYLSRLSINFGYQAAAAAAAAAAKKVIFLVAKNLNMYAHYPSYHSGHALL